MIAKRRVASTETAAKKTAAPTKAHAKTKRGKWRVSRPRRSAFAGATGDPTEYRVRMLDVPDTDEGRVREALADVVAVALRLAPRNLTRKRRFVLFAWDPVYTRLTVTFTDPQRRDEGPDVLKVSCTGWDAELQKLGDRKAVARGSRLGDAVFKWIHEHVLQAREVVARLARELGFKIVFAISDDPEGGWVQRL